MKTDWKDALNALKDSGAIPTDTTPDPIPSENHQHEVQKEAVHVVTDKKGRKGKTATIVEGLTCSQEELEELAKYLKQTLGTGGSTREGEILIQGDRKDDVARVLRDKGFRVR